MRRLSLLLLACCAPVVFAGCFHFDRNLSPGEITGTAVFRSAQGTLLPAAGATVVLENSGVSVVADGRGTFVLTGLPGGTYTLDVADSPPTLSSEVGLHLSLTLGMQDGLDLGQITLEALGAIQGSVQLDGDSIGPGAVATIAGLAQVMVAQGVFEFGTLLPGSYAVTVFYPDNPGAVVSMPTLVQVPPAGTVHTAFSLLSQSMTTAGAVQGAVQAAGAAGNGGIDIQFSGTGPDLTSSISGNYQSGGVPAGLYTVTASLGGFVTVSVPYVVVGGGTTTVPTVTILPVSGFPGDAGSMTFACVADSECPAGEVCVNSECGAPADGGNDAGSGDAGSGDAGPGDAGPGDAGPGDAGSADAGSGDAGSGDAGSADAGSPDAGPSTPPSPPTNVSATAGDGQAVITWTASTGATTYNLYYSSNFGAGTSGMEVSGITSPYVLQGLEDDSTYYIVVTAVNAGGESAASTQVRATPEPVPPVPEDVSAQPADKQVTLSWTVSNQANSYNVYWSATSGTGTNGTQIADVSSPASVTGLTDGNTYYFVVTAVNDYGESAPSAEISAMPVAGPPPVPTGVTATGGDRQISFQWNSLSGATGYNLYWSPIANSGTNADEVSDVVSPYQLTGLSAGTTYYAVVTATNGNGEGLPSLQVSATTLAPVPTGVIATPGSARITIAWTAQTGATAYNLYYSTSATAGTAGTQAANVSSPYALTGLTNGTTYYLVVTAVDGAGESAASSPVSATPEVVSGAKAVAGNGKITLSWNAVPQATSYNIYRSTTSGFSIGGAAQGTTEATTWVDTGVTNYTDYFYLVTALVSEVESKPSLQVSGTPVQWLTVSLPNYDGNYGLGVTSDGKLRAWGSNTEGVLGLGSAVTNEYYPTVVGTGTNWTSVTAGGISSFGVAGGALYSWGDDGAFGGLGCLGQGQAEASIIYTPTQIGTATNWASVVSDDNGNVCVSLALTTSGAVFNWADNFACPGSFRYGPVEVYSGAKAIALNVGEPDGLLVTTSGELFAWGYDQGWGLLGQGNKGSSYCPSSPTQTGTTTNWTAVAGGGDANLGIANGMLYAWGGNYTAQTGLGMSAPSLTYTPTQVGTATNWTAIYATTEAVFGLAGGALYAWGGDGGTGGLGLGSGQTEVYTPTQVGSATNWTFVAPSSGAAMALDADGNLWAWGSDNGTGMLGLGPNVTTQFTPTQVSVP